MADEDVLLSFCGSPYGLMVQIALEEKGVNYEYKEEDIWNKSPLLLQMNPVHKKVPILSHSGKVICESLVAVQYIDDAWNEKSPLLPSDPYHRAHARFWADYAHKKFKAGKRVCTTKGEKQEACKKEFLEFLKLLEEQLGDQPYFGRGNFGFLDVAIIPFYSWFQVIETFGEFKLEVEFPRYFDWVKRCVHRESVSKTLPNQQCHNVYGAMRYTKAWNDYHFFFNLK